MKFWTTFCPSKVCWELTFAQTQGKSPTSNWLDNQKQIISSLALLKKAGISGIRLVIFPTELTQDGKIFDWKPIDTMLKLCFQAKINVDLCLGPFQYPYYPGIYLPKKLLDEVFATENALDTVPSIKRYGKNFLTVQLERYSEDHRLRGFHFANEWPDKQHVSGKEKIKKAISEDFMIKAATLIKERTKKPIRVNTNIDLFDKKKVLRTFTELLGVFNQQGSLGFDIYPTQETWMRMPWQKLLRLFYSYSRAFRTFQQQIQPSQLYFAEIEAQPWGNGKSWFTLISQSPQPQEQILTYSRDSLQKTWNHYLKNSKTQEISLWGSDFWLVSHQMGITWPLEQVKQLTKQYHSK